MAHLTNFSFEFFYKIFTEDASLPLLYHGAKKSKMTKNSIKGGGGGILRINVVEHVSSHPSHAKLTGSPIEITCILINAKINTHRSPFFLFLVEVGSDTMSHACSELRWDR